MSAFKALEDDGGQFLVDLVDNGRRQVVDEHRRHTTLSQADVDLRNGTFTRSPDGSPRVSGRWSA